MRLSKNATALILLNGELGDARAVRAAANAADVVICADGGARHAKALGIVPDFIVGDMDSLPSPLLRTWQGVTSICDIDPECSDLDKALAFARTLGVRRVEVAGARGRGLDHELINVAILEESTEGLKVSVIERGTALLLGPGRHRLQLKRGDRFSLLAAPRARLSLTGARYVLKDELLLRGGRGLGNRASGPVTLIIREGRVWAVTQD